MKHALARAAARVDARHVARSRSEKTAATCSSSSSVIDELLDQAEAGGGASRRWSGCARGASCRCANASPTSSTPTRPFSRSPPLAGYGSDYAVGGGMIVGIGVIAGTECVIMANDPSVLGWRPDPVLGQEVDARARDRPRQSDSLRQLRRVRRGRPASREAAAVGECRPATSPRAGDSSTTSSSSRRCACPRCASSLAPRRLAARTSRDSRTTTSSSRTSRRSSSPVPRW